MTEERLIKFCMSLILVACLHDNCSFRLRMELTLREERLIKVGMWLIPVICLDKYCVFRLQIELNFTEELMISPLPCSSAFYLQSAQIISIVRQEWPSTT